MSGSASLGLRIWRMRMWSTNPLMRASDRCESAVRVLIVLVMLIAVPVACAAGTETYTRTAERIEIDNASKTMVAAVLSTAPKETAIVAGAVTVTHYEAQVQWERNGETATGTVTVAATASKGSTVQIWLGSDGKPCPPPQSPSTGVWNAAGAALGLLVVSWSAALGLLWCVTRLLARVRDARWEAELHDLARPIGT